MLLSDVDFALTMLASNMNAPVLRKLTQVRCARVSVKHVLNHWQPQGESWQMAHRVMHADPIRCKPSSSLLAVWTLQRTMLHASGHC